ncbi:helix-turn-helix domain-containing protein [Roseibium sp. RKSG952]|uniref:helix-turn-helix domain-containing protein n=1 Tax=Roseibium sp. RKSG952 TaxID=2529384 RepID=UPI0012BD0E3D|nr:helix-turn-helix transcriptional regulator [Roseibium sp. RKSG952]MTH95412.1 helix-turn-helix domain-containing protein [Roseibium sp. RKSG952]
MRIINTFRIVFRQHQRTGKMRTIGPVEYLKRNIGNTMDKNERLRTARKRAGFSSATSAAEAMSVNPTTYTSHENGHRDFDEDTAAKYARRFKVDVAWLVFGKGDEPSSDEPCSGGLQGSDIEDEELFLEAYREAREIEKELIGGPGPVIKFTKMVHIIYREKLSKREHNK